jgi:hypothetical protein
MTGPVFFAAIVLAAAVALAIFATPIFLVPIAIVVVAGLFGAPVFAIFRRSARPGASGTPTTGEASYDPVVAPEDRRSVS